MTDIQYFGPPAGLKEWEVHIPTPVGAICLHCDEAVIEGDAGTINLAGQLTHHECAMRGVIGSSAHQMRKCTCYGGQWEDPPGLTRRQAAIHAVNTFNRLHGITHE